MNLRHIRVELVIEIERKLCITGSTLGSVHTQLEFQAGRGSVVLSTLLKSFPTADFVSVLLQMPVFDVEYDGCEWISSSEEISAGALCVLQPLTRSKAAMSELARAVRRVATAASLEANTLWKLDRALAIVSLLGDLLPRNRMMPFTFRIVVWR